MDDLDEAERELLGTLHATMMCAGNNVVLSESQIQREFDKMEGEGELQECLSKCNVHRLEDFMSNFPNKFQRVGVGKWKPVNDGSQQHILNVMNAATSKRSKGGRGGSVSSRSRGGSIRGRIMGNSARNVNSVHGFKPMTAFNRGGSQSRPGSTYGSAFRKQPPPQNNVQNQRPLHRPPDHRVASKDFVPNYASPSKADMNYDRHSSRSPPPRRNDYRDDSRHFDDRRDSSRWNDDRDSGYNRKFDNQRRRTPSPPRRSQNYDQRSDYGGPSNYSDRNFHNDHYQDNSNRSRDIDARDYNASRGFFNDSAYDNPDYHQRSPSPQRRRYSQSPRRQSQRSSNWNGSPSRNERLRERTPPNYRQRSRSPPQRYNSSPPRNFNDRRGPGSFRDPSPVQSHRSFDDRRDRNPPREPYMSSSPVRAPSGRDEQSHRSYSSQRLDQSPERNHNRTDNTEYKKPERVVDPMNSLAQVFGSAHIGQQSGATETVTLDINVAEAFVDVLQTARKLESGHLDMSAIFSSFEKKNNTTFPGRNFMGKMKNLQELKTMFPDLLGPLIFGKDFERWDPSAPTTSFPGAPLDTALPPGVPPPPGLALSSFAPPGIAPPGFNATRCASPTLSTHSGRNEFAAPPPAFSRPPTSTRPTYSYSPYTADRPSNPDTELCRKIRQKVAAFHPNTFEFAAVCENLKESLGNMYSYEEIREELTYVLFVFYKNKFIYELGGTLKFVQLTARIDRPKNTPNFFREAQVNRLLISNKPRTLKVVTSFFNSFLKFGVQLKDEVEQFEKMDKAISTVFADGMEKFWTPLEKYSTGHACIALKDVGGRGIDKFHRGVVINVDVYNDTALVHFIDVGKTESVEQNCLFVMPSEFENTPAFGISCCCEWTTDELKSVKKLWGSRFHSESVADFLIDFVPGKELPPKTVPEVWTIPVEIYAELPNGVLLNIRTDSESR